VDGSEEERRRVVISVSAIGQSSTGGGGTGHSQRGSKISRHCVQFELLSVTDEWKFCASKSVFWQSCKLQNCCDVEDYRIKIEQALDAHRNWQEDSLQVERTTKAVAGLVESSECL